MISLKKADFNHIEFLWQLRNQPEIYRYFRNPKPVSLKKHIEWITPVILGQVKKEIFIIYKQKIPVGQLRFDYMDGETEVGISIIKEFQKKGFASEALNKAIDMKKKKILISEIHQDNIGSIKLFEKLNFKLKSKKEKWLKYILKLETGK